MKKLKSALLLIAAFLSLAPVATSANVTTYGVTVDTSSFSGTVGSLDFNFNPGPLVTQAASLQILNFSSDGGQIDSPSITGNVSGGPLPATLTFDNGSGFNDYFGGFQYGSTISFKVSLYGPALNAPDGVSTSGSTFAFSMFKDVGGTVPVLTSNATDGFAFTVDVNLNGTTTVTNWSAQTLVSSVPEPEEWAMLMVGIPLMGWQIRRKQGL